MEDVPGRIPAGQTEVVVSVPIVNDIELEQFRENFAVVLEVATRDGLRTGTSTATVTILDDDCKHTILKEPSHISFPITDICTLLFMIIRKRMYCMSISCV